MIANMYQLALKNEKEMAIQCHELEGPHTIGDCTIGEQRIRMSSSVFVNEQQNPK
jgi:hypothetical protein